MAMEAASQVGASRSLDLSAIELREVYSGQPLILTEGGDIEVMFVLRPVSMNAQTSSETWNEFRIFSWTEDSSWAEHCRGEVAVLSNNNNSDDFSVANTTSEILNYMHDVERVCVQYVESQELYNAIHRLGVEYGPCMRMLSNCRTGDRHALTSVEIPDTTSTMPCQSESTYIFHPALLDDCIQIVWLLLGAPQTQISTLYMPTSLKKMGFQLSTNGRQSNQVKVFGSSATAGSRLSAAHHVESIVVVDPGKGEIPFMTLEDLTLVALGGGQTKLEEMQKGTYVRIELEPCINLLPPETFRDLFQPRHFEDEESKLIETLERASLFYFQKTLEVVKEIDFPLLSSHHQKFYRFMQGQLVAAENGENSALRSPWQPIAYAEGEEYLTAACLAGKPGEFTCRIGENLPDILLNGRDTLSLMLQDGLLESYYRITGARVNQQAAMLADNLAHENPNLKILEVGAGTGGVTLPILERLCKPSDQTARLQEYVFTDISTGFFEGAEEKLSAWKHLLTFRKLNIEEDPVAQGFVPGMFDLIVAANVLHATARITRTVSNVRKLLRPGGRLLLVELTTPQARLFPFATLSGWWLAEPEFELDAATKYAEASSLATVSGVTKNFRSEGPLLAEDQWNTVLKSSGFSGVDHSLYDFPDVPTQSTTIMLSTASSAPQENVSSNQAPRLIVVQSHESTQIPMHEIMEYLSRDTAVDPPVRFSLSQTLSMDLKDSHCLFLDEVEHSVLANMSATDLDAIKNMCTAAGVLWVTRGGRTLTPDSGMALGLARGIRAEDLSLRLVTLDLDSEPKLSLSRTAELITRVYKAVFYSETKDQPLAQESEFVERSGIIYLPRAFQDLDTEQHIRKLTNDPVPQEQTYVDNSLGLSLKMGTVGLLDTFFFGGNDNLNCKLSPDEVEIQIEASALNYRDVLASLGKVPYRFDGLDCAGVISAVGSNVSDLVPNDRVCALAAGAFATVVRCPASCVVKIPEKVAFNVAASLPVLSTTVVHSLMNVAGLQKDESILIHAAAGGVGQVAIMISRSIGAEVFATVGSATKKEFLMSHYGLSEDRIFNSRDTSFEKNIMTATDRKGVDVALSSASAEVLRATWRCLAPFGRFVDISTADMLSNNKLEMQPFLRNRTYSAVDIYALAQEKPSLFKRLLHQSIELFKRGDFAPAEPITTFSYSQMEAAFRKMQVSDHIGKIVFVPKKGDRIKVCRIQKPQTRHRGLTSDCAGHATQDHHVISITRCIISHNWRVRGSGSFFSEVVIPARCTIRYTGLS